MGVAVRVTLFAPDRATAFQAASAAFGRFAELDAMMSDYQQDSELNRLCRATEPVEVSPDLFEVLRFALELACLSDGAFDVTSAPVVKLWRRARQDRRLPTSDSLSAALALVSYRRVHIDAVTRMVALDPGTTLDLGGIAKGYACDAALSVLTSHGIESAMVEAGGDLAVSGPPPGETGWRVSVPGLDRVFVLAHQAVSTSGDSEQSVEIEGVRYSHVVDPRTGLGLTRSRQVTVVGRHAFSADPIATAESVSPGMASKARLHLKLDVSGTPRKLTYAPCIRSVG